MSLSNRQFDAIIIGAGPSGLSSAILLAKAGWSTAVIEKNALPRPKVCGGYFGVENWGAWQRLGINNEILKDANPLSCVSLHAGDQQAIIGIDDHAQGLGALGLSRLRFDEILWEKAQALGIQIYDRAFVVDRSQAGLTVRSAHVNALFQLRAPVVIQASGAPHRSNIRGLFGASAMFKNIPLSRERVRMYFIDGAHVGINPCEKGLTNVGYVADQRLMARHQFNLSSVWGLFLKHYPELARAFQGHKGTNFKGAVIFPHRGGCWFNEKTQSFMVGDSVGVVNPLLGFGNTLAVASAIMLADLLSAHRPPFLPLKKIKEEYRQRWKKEFALKVKSSWFWGRLSHHETIMCAGLKILKLRSRWIKNIYAQYHPTHCVNSRISSCTTLY